MSTPQKPGSCTLGVVGNDFLSDTHAAECLTCGWHGPARAEYEAAVADLDEHRLAGALEPPR